MRILAIAVNDAERTAIVEKINGDIEFVTVDKANEKLKNGRYELVISAPENIIIGKKSLSGSEFKKECISALYDVFLFQNNALADQVKAVKDKIASAYSDAYEAENTLKEIYSLTYDKLFAENEWLELYISRESLNTTGEQLEILYREYTALFPRCTDKAAEVVSHILNNPESDLKQKTIAQKLYINSSYLSTIFAVQTGMRYVDYLTSVKLKRAAYLIIDTDLSIGEIAQRLDYKDIGYFSRLFKIRFGMSPSQYRLPYNYTYEI